MRERDVKWKRQREMGNERESKAERIKESEKMKETKTERWEMKERVKQRLFLGCHTPPLFTDVQPSTSNYSGNSFFLFSTLPGTPLPSPYDF